MDGLVAEIRRVRALFDGRRTAATGTFDLGDADPPGDRLRPGVRARRRRSSCRPASRSKAAATARRRSLVALLDNVRQHASSSPVDVRVAVLDDAVDRRSSRTVGRASRRCCAGHVFERGVRGERELRFGARPAHRPPADGRAGRVDRGPPPPRRWHVVRAALPAPVVMTARVLIVEDHALVAIGLQLALSARGWEVETTDGPTAADVIEHAQRFQPQVVLCDINLGEGVGSGIDLDRPVARHRRRGGDAHRRDPPRRAGRLSGGRGRRLDRQGRLPGRGRRRAHRCARRHAADRLHRPRDDDRRAAHRAGRAAQGAHPVRAAHHARARGARRASSTACRPRRSPTPNTSR